MSKKLLLLGLAFNLKLLSVSDNFFDQRNSMANSNCWLFANIKEIRNKTNVIDAHDNFLTKICIADNNKFAVTSSFDKTLKIWDLKSQSSTNTLSNEINKWITALKVTKDNKYIIAGDFKGEVKVWNLNLNKTRPITKFNYNQSSEILGIEIDYDKNIFIVAGSDGIISINNLNSIGNSLKSLLKIIHSDEIDYTANAFTINKDYIFIAKQNQYIKAFSIDNYNLDKTIDLNTESNIKKLYILNNYLIAVFNDLIKLYDIENNFKEISCLEIKQDVINDFPCTNVSIGFYEQEEFIVYINKNSKVSLYNIKTKESKELFDGNNITCLDVFNNQIILAGDTESNLTIYNQGNGLINKLTKVFEVDYFSKNEIKKRTLSLGPIAISANGENLVICSSEGKICILKLNNLFNKIPEDFSDVTITTTS